MSKSSKFYKISFVPYKIMLKILWLCIFSVDKVYTNHSNS